MSARQPWPLTRFAVDPPLGAGRLPSRGCGAVPVPPIHRQPRVPPPSVAEADTNPVEQCREYRHLSGKVGGNRSRNRAALGCATRRKTIRERKPDPAG